MKPTNSLFRGEVALPNPIAVLANTTAFQDQADHALAYNRRGDARKCSSKSAFDSECAIKEGLSDPAVDPNNASSRRPLAMIHLVEPGTSRSPLSLQHERGLLLPREEPPQWQPFLTNRGAGF